MSALAINVTTPPALRWTDTRHGEEFTLTTFNVRLLPDGHLRRRPMATQQVAVAAPTSRSRPLIGPSWRSSLPKQPAVPAPCGPPTAVFG